MSVLIAINTILSADVTITAEVGTKIYPQKAAQNTANPCIITNVISTNPTNTKDNVSPLDIVIVSLDIYSERNDEAFRLAALARTALDGMAYKVGALDITKIVFMDEMGFTDPMADSYRVNQTYTLRVRR